MLLIANLGFEAELAAGPRRTLGRDALLAATRAGAVLRVLARRGDTVWLPGPPGRLRLAPVPGVPSPDLIHGPLPRSFNGPVLAWGETTATASLGTGAAVPVEGDSPVLAALLAGPRPDPATACLANGKTFLEPLRRDLGCPLPGSGLVRSVDDLCRLAEDCRRIYGDGAGWVLKGDYSAAGRERIVERSGKFPVVRVMEAAMRLLRRHRACLFEPWLNRSADFGCSLLIGEERTVLVGVHRLLVSPAGRFQGVETVLGSRSEPAAIGPEPFERYLPPNEAVRMSRVASGVAAALAGIGYFGPAGIDFWRYADRNGEERVNLLGEINARLTFGLLARVLAQRIGAALGSSPETVLRLRFGRGEESPHGQWFPLVADGEDGRALAWLELEQPSL